MIDKTKASEYPSKCPACGSSAYVGLSKVECSNSYCDNHPQSASLRAFIKMCIDEEKLHDLTRAGGCTGGKPRCQCNSCTP